MSTFTVEGAKVLDILVPEFKWKALDNELYSRVFDTLLNAEPLRSQMLAFIQKKRPRIGYHEQYKSGGGWTIFGNITLTPGDDPLDPYVLSLIIHETYHLTQSILTRLSMQGELKAWQLQARTYPEIARTKGNRIGAKNEAYSNLRETCDDWDELLRLSPDSRADLEKAQDIMVRIAPTYRSHALPLFPIHREILYFLQQWRLGDAVGVILKLFKAAG